MGTRLDRLIHLLDSGSTPALRKQAAAQLGQIAAAHPSESMILLSRVAGLLRYKAQDARLAGAWAIEAVVENAPSWPPAPLGASEISFTPRGGKRSDVSVAPTANDSVPAPSNGPLASLTTEQLLAQPHLLAASASAFVTAGPAPSLREQRERVDKELGMEYTGVEVVGDTDLKDPNSNSATNVQIKTEEPTQKPLPKIKIKMSGPPPSTATATEPQPQPAENLSVRQQMMAKKKAKLEVNKLGISTDR